MGMEKRGCAERGTGSLPALGLIFQTIFSNLKIIGKFDGAIFINQPSAKTRFSFSTVYKY